MGKKDFSNSTENVFSDFFSQPIQPVKTVEKKVETKPAEVKKEVKTTPKKVDTPKQTETKKNVKTTPKKEKVETKVEEKTKEQISTPEIKKEESKVTPKSYNKDCRYNFYLDTDLADFISNYLWLTKNRSYSQYFNNLIKQDFLRILGLPADTSNEEMVKKWEEYKKEHDL